jgi:hypothetical protein
VDITYVVALVDVQICVHVSLVSAIHSSCHAGPGLLEGKDALDIVAVNLLSRNGVDDDGFDAKKWERSAAGLGRTDSSKRSDDVGTSFSLPVCL